jgi:group II intron reverse transcriptase/maturase
MKRRIIVDGKGENTKNNLAGKHFLYTEAGEIEVRTKLTRITEISKANHKEQFNNLIHLINPEMLKMCHKEMEANKAAGIDGVIKSEYEKDLEANIERLWEKLKNFSYKPQPVKRVFIPKEGSDKGRPLGIPAYEDRLVQSAMAKILAAIYEPIFMEYSYGFRGNRGCHQALGALTYVLENKNIRYVVDADIKSFFDTISHEWVIAFLEHKITDKKFVRLIKRILMAPVEEKGKLTQSERGCPQGGPISPIIANVYLHYVLDLWFEKVVKKENKGASHMVRYADDYVCCFEREYEAKEFLRQLKMRVKKFNLELAEDKTKMIMFGRFAEKDMKNSGKGKPSTFDFLGFTHYCSRSADGRRFRVKRTTSKKKKKASRLKISKWIKENRHERPKWLVAELNRKLVGYFNYYGVTDNGRQIQNMREYVVKTLYKALRRRSNRNKLTWESFGKMLGFYKLKNAYTKVNIYHVIKTLAIERL